jgi:hypothetical protein
LRRGVTEILRRGLDNAVANWPLIAFRFGETVLFGIVAFATALAVVVPILVSMGFVFRGTKDPQDVVQLVATLAQKWPLLVWIFILITALLGFFLAIHSFVEAGRARVLLQADANAGPGAGGPRSRFATVPMQEWVRGGAAGWLPVFWIYNLTWGTAGLVLLIPLAPTLILTLVLHGRPKLALAAGCIGLLLTLMLLVAVGFVTGIWTSRAIVEWAAGYRKPSDAVTVAWRAMRADFGRHFLVAVAVLVVSIATGAAFASVSVLAGFGQGLAGDHGALTLVTFPIRIAASLLSSIVSAAISSWSLASFAALKNGGD